MATQPDGTETEWKSGVHPWFVASSLKWLVVKLQALSSRNGLQVDDWTPRVCPAPPKLHVHPGNCSRDTGLSKPGRQGTRSRGTIVTLIATVIPGTEFLLRARPPSPVISNPGPTRADMERAVACWAQPSETQFLVCEMGPLLISLTGLC